MHERIHELPVAPEAQQPPEQTYTGGGASRQPVTEKAEEETKGRKDDNPRSADDSSNDMYRDQARNFPAERFTGKISQARHRPGTPRMSDDVTRRRIHEENKEVTIPA